VLLIASGLAGATSISMPSSINYLTTTTITATANSTNDTIALYINGIQIAIGTGQVNYTLYNTSDSTSYYSAGVYNITATDETANSTTSQNLTINQLTPQLILFSNPALDTYAYAGTPYSIEYGINTYQNQLTASLYIDNNLIGNTTTTANYSQPSPSTGTYLIIVNTTGNQNYTTNTVFAYLYLQEPNLQLSQATASPFISTNINPNQPDNATSLNSQSSISPYSGSLIIYLNPAGYFEFVLSNSSTTSLYNNYLYNNAELYQNTAPDQYMLNPIPYSLQFNSSINGSLNYTYVGSIFYMPSMVDISPIVNCVLANATGSCANPQSSTGAVATGLEPAGLFAFLSQSPIQYNTTLVFQSNNLTLSEQASNFLTATLNNLNNNVYSGITSLANIVTGSAPATTSGVLNTLGSIGCASQPMLCIGVSLFQASSQSNYNELIVPQQAVIPYLSTVYNNNEPLAVYFNYAGNFISSNPNNQNAVYTFDGYYNNYYEPSEEESQFMTNGIILILSYTIILFILMKFNGE